MGILFHFGRYALFIRSVFSKPDKYKIFFRRIVDEMVQLGISSIGIVTIISFFIGAVVTLQTAYNLYSHMPIIPGYVVSLVTRDSVLLEFASTLICLILAGKVGSHVASEIGTMRVTEQIDALDLMGINSANYLVLPKVLGLMIMVPFLSILSMAVGIFGGWISGAVTGAVLSADYIQGIVYAFVPFFIVHSIVKSVVFAFIITSIAGYCGYYTSGGSLEVGRSSTQAVVQSSIWILVFDLILTKLLLP
ncbi:MAG: ABC transporter permease [Cytophagaceae bacterium]|jgi:phospholipid/cholesterol/gamma-HCH transport system permease protein|nr:ABC transporter permease [Cytophagaceae bacterium]